MRPNLPNSISIFRVVMIPVFMVFVLMDTPAARVVAVCAFVIASLSDFIDGFLARRRHQTTILGAFLDPLADKLLVTAALISLVSLNKLSAWIAMVVLARELAVSGLRMVAAMENVVIYASVWGKVKTNLQMFRYEWRLGGHHVTWYFVVVMLVVTVGSGIEYFVRARLSLRGRPASTGAEERAT
jgi:CDP-diacylglycerol---glycerol-3-phosphate 3-phosphatidyltransferase